MPFSLSLSLYDAVASQLGLPLPIVKGWSSLKRPNTILDSNRSIESGRYVLYELNVSYLYINKMIVN